MKTLRLAAFVTTLVFGSAPAWAAISFTATGSGGRNATASFDLVAGQLQITLTNNATAGSGTAGSWVPIDILSGLFFNMKNGSSGVTALDAHAQSKVSQFATAGAETTVYAAGRDIGSEWAAKSGSITSGAITIAGVNYGLSSAGLGGAFGSGDIIGNDPDTDLEGIGGTPPDGLAYSIIGGAASTYANNGGVAGRSLVKGTATFILQSLPTGFALTDINYVVFNYGTALAEGGILTCADTTKTCSGETILVPAPGSLALAGVALLSLAGLRRRRAVR